MPTGLSGWLSRWTINHRPSTATVFDHRGGFQLKQKTAVALVDLTAAYDTVWHQGLRLKLLRRIPDKYLVAFIMETLSNRRFVRRASDRQESRARRLKNGVPQGSMPCLSFAMTFSFIKHS